MPEIDVRKFARKGQTDLLHLFLVINDVVSDQGQIGAIRVERIASAILIKLLPMLIPFQAVLHRLLQPLLRAIPFP